MVGNNWCVIMRAVAVLIVLFSFAFLTVSVSKLSFVKVVYPWLK